MKLLVVLMLCACASQAKRLDGPTTLVGGNALRYNEVVGPPPSTPLSDAIMAAAQELSARHQRPAPIADSRLFDACAALARVVPEFGTLPYSNVEFAFNSHGLVEPSPHLLVIHGDIRQTALVVANLRPSMAKMLETESIARFGVGTYGGPSDGVVVVAFQESHVRTSPIPRELAMGATADIDLSVESGYQQPRVLVTRASGKVERLALTPRNDWLHVEIACRDERGRIKVDIDAIGPTGDDRLASFPVWCDVVPPDSISVQPRANALPVNPFDAERRMLALLNESRAQAGLAPLAWDDDLAAAARDHSDDMRLAGEVSGMPKQPSRTTISNVGRAYDVGEALDGFLDAPSTRAPLMSAATTRIGIGIVYGKILEGGAREAYITQLMTVSPAQ